MPAGEEVLTYCSTCDRNVTRTIVAHKSGNSGPVAKVHCRICSKVKAYRAPKGMTAGAPKAPRKKAGSQRAKPVAVSLESEWQRQLQEAQGKPSRAYAVSEKFEKGDVVEHPSFGVGVVQGPKDANKVEILFQASMRVLLHNKA